MNRTHTNLNRALHLLTYLSITFFCFALAGCNFSFSIGGNNTTQCQINCVNGTGARGVQMYVEPDDGEQAITGAIKSASKSVWLEMYILSDRNVIRALEDAVNKGLDVR